MSDSARDPGRVLMLSTIHASHARHSGYGRLADYVPGVELLRVTRAEPDGAPPFLARLARKFALSRWYAPSSAALEWQALQRLCGGFEGIIHCLWADQDLGYLDLFTRRNRHRFCSTFHNTPDDFTHTIRFPARLRKFAAIILMSECQRPFFRDAGVPDDRVHVVLHGVDTAYFAPAMPRDDEPFTVVSAGGFRRNFPLLRQVCERLAGMREIHFKVIAPANFRPYFSDLANVDFFTGLDDAELLGQYQNASCLLHATEQATANNVLLEALACGVPVVAERIGGIPEYVTPECAVLTAPGDAAALADAVLQLARSPRLRSSMGAAARRRAEELAWPNVASRMLDLYRSLA